MRTSWTLRVLGALALLLAVVSASPPAQRGVVPYPSPALVPPRPPKHFRRQIDPSASFYAPAFLPTPLPPLEADFVAAPEQHPREHKLAQPKKPVYHYTPIKPFSEEDLGDVYKGKASPPLRDLATRYGNTGVNLFEPAAVGENLRGGSYGERAGSYRRPGPQVHEINREAPLPSKPILPPTPIAPEPTVHVGPGVNLQVSLPVYDEPAAALIPDTELVDIKAIRLGEAVGLGAIGSGVVQRQNPAHEKYHFEYRVRDHLGEFGHAEAKDGQLTTGGYDVNLHKTHVQSVRYFVDSKEVPVYAHQYQHV